MNKQNRMAYNNKGTKRKEDNSISALDKNHIQHMHLESESYRHESDTRGQKPQGKKAAMLNALLQLLDRYVYPNVVCRNITQGLEDYLNSFSLNERKKKN